MLFFSTAVHETYALCHLDRARTGEPPSSRAVAAALGTPREQNAKVVRSLNHALLVQSIRGRHGESVLDAMNPLDNGESLPPETRWRDSGRMGSAYRGYRRSNHDARQALAGELRDGPVGTGCQELGASIRERRAEFVCATQGERIP